jgi:hypothetical protein
MAPECSHMTTICQFPFWFQWKHLSRLPKLWNFQLVDSKCFQIKLITNKFFFTGRCHFQLSNIRITKRFWLAGDYDYLRGATTINHQVALLANFKMYSLVAVTNEILKRESSKCILDLPRLERRGNRIVTLG